MNGGQIILADEPTGALDSQSGDEVMTLLDDLASRGHTVILITHEQNVADHADRQIEIRDGQVVKDTGDSIRAQKRRARMQGSILSSTVHTASATAEIGEAVRMAFASLRANKFRTALTLLGIVIGVASVISMLAIGQGAQRDVIERITSMGANQLYVSPNWGRGGNAATLSFSDAELLADSVPNVHAVLPEISGEETLRFGNRDYSASVTATSANLPKTRNWPVASGVFFTDNDSDTYTPVAVLGTTARKNLFPDNMDPIGKYILIRRVPFLVIGVMTSKGASGFGGRDQDNVVFVPLKTGGLRLFGQRFLRSITVAVEKADLINDTAAAVSDYFLQRHGSEDFRIFNSAELIENVSESRETFTMLLGSVAAISLLVGGIGVMNIMLVSVTERTREIGVRMATGARQKDILLQFLTEAIVVSSVGGGLGVLLGFGVGTLLDKLGTSAVFTSGPVLLAFGCATATGLVFGFAPARKAARLDPVVALASE